MRYDFETVISRKGVGAFKWDAMERQNPNVGGNIVPLSVADMEFYNAPEIINGLKDYLSTNVLGYTGPTEDYFNSIISWMERRHGFSPKREWIVQTPGVVPALYDLVGALTKSDEAVLILSPVYYPFRGAAQRHGRTLVESSLLEVGLNYEIDFADFELKASDPRVTLCIFCSPHNPIGRVWTREELTRVAQICHDNGVVLVCDEIHHDLILPRYKHVSAGTLNKTLLDNTIICTAPSKTFNLAGMQTSNIIISSDELRKKVDDAGAYFSLNALGYKACQLAYDKCEAWLEQLMLVIDENRQLCEDFIAKNIPQIRVFPLQGTYLQWWDLNPLGMDYRVMEQFLVEKAQLYIDEGSLFGAEGNGYLRINLACPKTVLRAALERLNNSLSDLDIVHNR